MRDDTTTSDPRISSIADPELRAMVAEDSRRADELEAELAERGLVPLTLDELQPDLGPSYTWTPGYYTEGRHLRNQGEQRAA